MPTVPFVSGLQPSQYGLRRNSELLKLCFGAPISHRFLAGEVRGAAAAVASALPATRALRPSCGAEHGKDVMLLGAQGGGGGGCVLRGLRLNSGLAALGVASPSLHAETVLGQPSLLRVRVFTGGAKRWLLTLDAARVQRFALEAEEEPHGGKVNSAHASSGTHATHASTMPCSAARRPSENPRVDGHHHSCRVCRDVAPGPWSGRTVAFTRLRH
jgi:hypothetical protein